MGTKAGEFYGRRGRNLDKWAELSNFVVAMPLKDDIRELHQLLEGGEGAIPTDLAERFVAEAPYFALPTVLAANNAPISDMSDDERSRIEALRHRAALSAPDAQTFAMLADDFYPDSVGEAKPETAEAITTFLDVYGHAPTKEEDALLERMIMNPIPDYAATLEAEADGDIAMAHSEDDTQGSLIDAFIAGQQEATTRKQAEPEPAAQATAPIEVDTAAPLAESLAKTFIRQGRYAKAYEMFMQLNLNNPEKSVYFATQLRFLRKLKALGEAAKADEN